MKHHCLILSIVTMISLHFIQEFSLNYLFGFNDSNVPFRFLIKAPYYSIVNFNVQLLTVGIAREHGQKKETMQREKLLCDANLNTTLPLTEESS